jgi:hypothetical protein
VIVDPDFMDHWRTGMVADAIGDPMAPVYILRLWAHCQERKSDRFVMPTRGLKAQCKAPVDAELFEAALIEAGFVERNGAELIVCGWAEKNASLIAAWSNGNKGGRPKKEPKENPRETQEEPSENPSATQAKPIREEKRREEEIREETGQENPPAARVPPSADAPGRATKKCPKAFALSPELVAWAAEKFPELDPHAELETMRDHTFANARSDWDGTWRNWMRRARGTGPAPPHGQHRIPAFAKGAAIEAHNQAVLDRLLSEEDTIDGHQ